MAEYKLYYFDARGIAEPARLIMSYAGVKFEDIRASMDTSTVPPQLPAEIKDKCPFGQVPILEDKQGNILAQSAAISRFLARKYNLTGKDEWEAAKCDEYADAIKDLITEFRPAYLEKDEAKKAELLTSIFASTKPKYLVKLNNYVEANGGKHLVGNCITWVDILLAHMISHMEIIYNLDLHTDFPAIKALCDNVFAAKGIQEWIKNRPNTKF